MSKLLWLCCWFLFMAGLWSLIAREWGTLSQAPVTVITLIFLCVGICNGIYYLLYKERIEILNERLKAKDEDTKRRDEDVKRRDEEIASLKENIKIMQNIIVEGIKKEKQSKNENLPP